MKFLLLSDMPPCNNYTAGIVLDKMCDFLLEEGHELCCYTVKCPKIFPEIPDNKKTSISYVTESRPYESWGQRKYGFLYSLIMNNYSSIVLFPPIAKRVANFAIEQDVQMIWGVVQGHSTISILKQVTKITKLPYVVQSWDPSTWYLKYYKYDPFTTALIMQTYSSLLKNSMTFIASSWAMAEEYSKKYGSKSIPVLPGLDEGIVPHKKNKDSSVFIIAFAGQMYASDEIKSLINATKQIKCDKKIIVRIYGKDWQMDFNDNQHIEIKGWLSQNELIEELAEADLLYCPYGFEKSFKEIARLSFPSKLVCYLKTGKPVLFHGPDYSSPGIFLKKYNAGYICNTLDYIFLSNFILNIINDPNRDIIAKNGFNAFTENLTLKKMKNNFFAALNIE